MAMRTVITVAVDLYDSNAEPVSTVVGARASAEAMDPFDLLELVLGDLGSDFKQMTAEQIANAIQGRRGTYDLTWEQLSIF